MSEKRKYLAKDRADAAQNMLEVARAARGEQAPAPYDPYARATLTGDMAASSPYQQHAAAQFDANMRGAAQTPEPESPWVTMDRLKREAEERALALQQAQQANMIRGD